MIRSGPSSFASPECQPGISEGEAFAAEIEKMGRTNGLSSGRRQFVESSFHDVIDHGVKCRSSCNHDRSYRTSRFSTNVPHMTIRSAQTRFGTNDVDVRPATNFRLLDMSRAYPYDPGTSMMLVAGLGSLPRPANRESGGNPERPRRGDRALRVLPLIAIVDSAVARPDR